MSNSSGEVESSFLQAPPQTKCYTVRKVDPDPVLSSGVQYVVNRVIRQNTSIFIDTNTYQHWLSSALWLLPILPQHQCARTSPLPSYTIQYIAQVMRTDFWSSRTADLGGQQIGCLITVSRLGAHTWGVVKDNGVQYISFIDKVLLHPHRLMRDCLWSLNKGQRHTLFKLAVSADERYLAELCEYSSCGV